MAYYEFSPSTAQNMTAGTPVSFTVTARDDFGNGVINSDIVEFTALGSTTAVFTPDSTLSFASDSTVSVSVTDTKSGNFTVRALKQGTTGVTGQSGLITVNPAPADSLLYVSGNSNSVVAGNDRLLRVKVTDRYLNAVQNESIRFIVRSGGGNFSGGDSVTVQSDSTGLAEAELTTGPSVGANTAAAFIVSNPPDSVQFTVNTVPGSISYFTVVPSTFSTTAGTAVNVTVNGFDTNNNMTTNDNSTVVQFSATGSGITLTPASDTLSAGTTTFTSVDTVAEQYVLKATSQSDSSKSGSSDPITVTPAGADHFTILTSQAPITAGTNRLLQVRLEDVYGNDVVNRSVTFTRFHGDGVFDNGLATIQDNTNASGVAEALYTASSSTVFGSDSLSASFGGVVDTLVLPLQAGAVSYYTFVPSGDSTIVAGDSLAFTLTAGDQFGNPKPNSGTVNLTAVGSSTAGFSSSTLNFNGGSTVNLRVSDSQSGNFTVRAVNSVNGDITGQSGLITVIAAPANAFTFAAGVTDSITVGTERLISVNLQDAFGNPVPNVFVVFQRQTGTGIFPASSSLNRDSIHVKTNTSGTATANYRASTSTASSADVISVTYGTVSDTAVIPLKPGPISYFKLTILSPLPDTAGSRIQIKVAALDVYENPVVNSRQYQAFAVGDPTAQFLPSDLYTFSSDSIDTVTVTTHTAGQFTVQTKLVSDPSKQGSSSQITITAASLSQLRLRSRAGNKGVPLGGVNDTLTSSESRVYYAAGYDQFDNYIDDIDSTKWNLTGTLQPATPPPASSSSFTFEPQSTGSGTIFISIPTSLSVRADTTGVITVTSANLAFIKIQLDSTAGATEVGNRNFRSGDTLRLYAVGYDIDNNWLGTVSSNWSINNPDAGFFQNGLPNLNDARQALFTADRIGNAVVTAQAVTDTSINDQTGLFTVTGGPSDHVILRSGANNAGFAYRDTTLQVSADSSLSLFAAFYDAAGNYLGDSTVTWRSSGLVNGPSGKQAASIVFSPTKISSGNIFTETGSAVTNDTTGLITVIPGNTVRMQIQSLPTDAGVELDTMTLVAGEDTTLYAGGYDSDNNLTGLIPSDWALEGDPIGILDPGPANSSLLQAQTMGTARVKASEQGGTLTDFTSNIVVIAGSPDSMLISGGNGQTGAAGQELPLPIQVQILDSLSNEVGGITVRFTPLAGGRVNGNLNFADVITDYHGVASATWTLHPDTTADSVRATVPGFNTTPQQVTFIANVTSGTPFTLEKVGPDTLTGEVATTLGSDFMVRILDELNNAVPNTRVNFAIVGQPAGGSGAVLSRYSAQTLSDGTASTRLTLGSKLGTYTVRAFADSTNPISVDFYGIADTPGAPRRITGPDREISVISGKYILPAGDPEFTGHPLQIQ